MPFKNILTLNSYATLQTAIQPSASLSDRNTFRVGNFRNLSDFHNKFKKIPRDHIGLEFMTQFEQHVI